MFGIIVLVAATTVAPPVEGQAGRPASEPGPPQAAPAPRRSPTDPSPLVLYEHLARTRRDYQAALQRILDGEPGDAARDLGAAAEALRQGAETCLQTSGCDVSRFLAAFDDLVVAQTLALQRERSRLASLQTDVELEEERIPSGGSPFVSAMPEIGETVALMHGIDFRSVIKLNDKVRAALDDWLTWMRPNLMESYENYQFLRRQIAPIYLEAGLPEALLFGMLAAESRGRVHSFSRAGAAGPLQFMRATGRAYGLRDVDGFDMRLDPVAATKANVAYLNAQFEALNKDLEKTLAAYNGGEGRMRRLHRRFRDVSLWDPRVYYSLPRETREYVPRILAAAWLFLNPDDYNLDWPAYETETAELVLRREASLGELTICLGQVGNSNGWFRTLRNLNPRVGADERIEAGARVRIPAQLVPAYEAQCLAGAVIDRAEALHEANYPDGSDLIPYVVQSGDTLGRIASRLPCVSIGELAAMNGLRPPRFLIRIGQRLRIPNCR